MNARQRRIARRKKGLPLDRFSIFQARMLRNIAAGIGVPRHFLTAEK